MSKYFRPITGLLLILSLGCHPPTPAPSLQDFQTQLARKNFFQLRAWLAAGAQALAPQKRLYFQAYVDNAFNRNDASDSAIHRLLGEPGLADSTKVQLLLLQEDNDFKTFRYAQATAANNLVLTRYRAAIDSVQYADISNKNLIDSGLMATPPQRITLSGSTTIPWHKDKVGLIEIPVRMGDSSVSSIFDTRANISSISETYARKLGVHILPTRYKEGSGITGNSFEVSLGVADSLRLGSILLQQVVFQVMPDSILYIAPIDFRMNIVIGYPVIAQLREIQIYRDGRMTIPAQPTPSPLQNMAMDGLTPLVSCIAGKDTLIFKFDTGASSTDLFDTYFRRYAKDVQAQGQRDTVSFGGAGGVVREPVYVLKGVHLKVGSELALLDRVTVHIHPIPNTHEVVYGNLGQDLMRQFNEMILNFESMYIDFR
jgi:predicted aspartyl protease